MGTGRHDDPIENHVKETQFLKLRQTAEVDLVRKLSPTYYLECRLMLHGSIDSKGGANIDIIIRPKMKGMK